MNCSDCGFPANEMSARTLAKGSSVREPGESLCRSCTSARITMVRALERVPNNLTCIKALRAPKVGSVA